MGLNFKILVFGTQWNNKAEKIGDELRYMLKGYLQPGKEIAFYESMSEALPEFYARFQGTDVIFLLADPSIYAQTKKMLSDALRLRLQAEAAYVVSARKRLGDFDVNSEEMLAHCMVPEGKQSFCMDDGLYSGFAATAGKQNMILLPFEKERTVRMLGEQVFPYLNHFYDISLDIHASERYHANLLAQLLEEKESMIAVSGTKTSVFLRGIAEQDPVLASLLRFTPSAESIGNLQPVEYAVNLSIAASELEDCPYGAAITNAYYTGNDMSAPKKVFIAFTDEDDSAVREITSFPDETVELFLNRCALELIEFAIERITDAEEKTQEEEAPKAFVSRSTMTVLTSIAAVGAVLCVLVSFLVTNLMIKNREQDNSGMADVAITDVLQPTTLAPELPTETATTLAPELPTETATTLAAVTPTEEATTVSNELN